MGSKAELAYYYRADGRLFPGLMLLRQSQIDRIVEQAQGAVDNGRAREAIVVEHATFTAIDILAHVQCGERLIAID